jgi:uncharacterized repeat protein (TIGR02543 family)
MFSLLHLILGVVLASALVNVRAPSYNSLPADTWLDSHYDSSFDGGDGTSGNPYQINDAGSLAYLSYLLNENTNTNSVTAADYADKYYILTSDIDMSSHIWVPIGILKGADATGQLCYCFQGNFNGNHHVIKGLYLNNTYETYSFVGTTAWKYNVAGFFGNLYVAPAIYNLTLKYSGVELNNISYNTRIGLFAGSINTGASLYIHNDKVIADCPINISYLDQGKSYSSSSQTNYAEIAFGGFFGSIFSTGSLQMVFSNNSFTSGTGASINFTRNDAVVDSAAPYIGVSYGGVVGNFHNVNNSGYLSIVDFYTDVLQINFKDVYKGYVGGAIGVSTNDTYNSKISVINSYFEIEGMTYTKSIGNIIEFAYGGVLGVLRRSSISTGVGTNLDIKDTYVRLSSFSGGNTTTYSGQAVGYLTSGTNPNGTITGSYFFYENSNAYNVLGKGLATANTLVSYGASSGDLASTLTVDSKNYTKLQEGLNIGRDKLVDDNTIGFVAASASFRWFPSSGHAVKQDYFNNSVTYRVTFDLNGSTGVNTKDQFVSYNGNAMSPVTPTKGSDTFIGWFNSSNTKVSFPFAVTSDITLTAIFNKYFVTFNSNGGSSVDTIFIDKDSKITKPTDPTKAGSVFDAWYKESTFDTKWDFTNDTVTSDITLYAKWLAEYTVKFYVNGKGNSSFSDLTAAADAKITSPGTPTADNYTFVSWCKDAEGTEVWDFTTDTVTSDITLYAKWSADVYSVSLNADGGTIASGKNVTSYTYGVGATLPGTSDVTKSNYNFLGWFDASNNQVSEISATDSGNKSFTAHYSAVNYSITYEVNGGTIKDAVYMTGYATSDTITLPTNVTKDDYTFAGWYNNSSFDGDPISQFGPGATGNLTFYAKYNAVIYTITYETNGGIIAGDYATSYTYGNEVALPTNVTKSNSEFLGWYNNSSFTGDVVTSILSTEKENKTFYAKWKVTYIPIVYPHPFYDISYELTNAVILGEPFLKYQTGDKVILPSVKASDGYLFEGWYLDDRFIGGPISELSEFAQGDFDFVAKVVKDTFKENEKDVYIYINNFSDLTIKGTYKVNDVITLPTNLTQDGYKFVGCYDNPWYQGEMISSITIKDHTFMTVYPKWIKA